MDKEIFLNVLHNANMCKKLTKEIYDNVDLQYPVVISNHLKKEILEKKSPGIYKQFLPCKEELIDNDGVGAFFEDEKKLTNTVVQKYPNRCIIYATSKCFANCRHCSRKENWKNSQTFSKFEFDKAYLTISQHPNIEEVIITGGDALTISPENIDYMLNKLQTIDHIQVIRIGTRVFTSNPEAVTDELCNILKKYQSLVISTQFNHPDEFSKETIDAIDKVQSTGTIIFNQSTLLKDINDDYNTMKRLLEECAKNRVIPYYLFHCFKVKGAQCFRTSVKTGIDIINQLVGNIGGWWIPRYVLIPHQTGSKVPVAPNGILKVEDEKYLLKDFRGRIIEYV